MALIDKLKKVGIKMLDPSPGNMLSGSYNKAKSILSNPNTSIDPALQQRLSQTSAGRQRIKDIQNPSAGFNTTLIPKTPPSVSKPPINQYPTSPPTQAIAQTPTQTPTQTTTHPPTLNPLNRPMVTMTGEKITVYKNGKSRQIDKALLPSFEKAGFSTIQTPTVSPQETISAPEPVKAYNWFDEAKKKMAITAPTFEKQPDYISNYGLTNENIEANLQRKKDAIRQKYDQMRLEAEQTTESERMSTLAASYAPGESNPLASGGASINEESNRRLNQRKDAISAMEAEEIAQAEAEAYGRKVEGARLAQGKYLEQQAKLQQEFENQKSILNQAVSFAKTGRTFQQEDKQNAFDNFSNLISLGGSQAFEGYKTEDYEALDRAMGYKTGTSQNIATKIKNLELQGQNEIMKLDDGSVINIMTKPDGSVSYDTIIKPNVPITTKAPTTQKFGEQTYQWNADTGQWELPAGVYQDTIQGQGRLSTEQLEGVVQARNKVSMIDALLNNPNIGKVFGLLDRQTSRINPNLQLIRNQVSQLINDLVLDERGRLKGSGQISDFETKIIAKAATQLGTNLNDEQAKAVLLDLKNKFENVEKASYLSQALGMTQKEAAMYIENLKQETGVYPTFEELQTSFPTFNQPLSTGVKGSLTTTALSKYPEGVRGGQCGDFAHKLVDFPSIGNGKNDKIKSVEKFGIPAPIWKQNPQVGDVIVTDENPTYGHVAVVLDIKQNGDLVLAESNYKQSEIVSYGRTINVNSPKIYGAIRGNLKG